MKLEFEQFCNKIKEKDCIISCLEVDVKDKDLQFNVFKCKVFILEEIVMFLRKEVEVYKSVNEINCNCVKEF